MSPSNNFDQDYMKERERLNIIQNIMTKNEKNATNIYNNQSNNQSNTNTDSDLNTMWKNEQNTVSSPHITRSFFSSFLSPNDLLSLYPLNSPQYEQIFYLSRGMNEAFFNDFSNLVRETERESERLYGRRDRAIRGKIRDEMIREGEIDPPTDKEIESMERERKRIERRDRRERLRRAKRQRR
jgi:hypothetical protein